MNRWLRLAATVPIALGISGCFPGCGLFGLPGMLVRDTEGRPVPHATVTLVALEEGQASRLAEQVRLGEPLQGWSLATDAGGRLKARDLTRAGLNPRRLPPPERIVFVPEAGIYATADLACEGPNAYRPHRDQPLAYVVTAPGRLPCLGTLHLRRRGESTAVELKPLAGPQPERRHGDYVVTLAPEPATQASNPSNGL